MTTEPNDSLSRDDREWLDQVARAYAPEPRTPMQRIRFVTAIAERREQRGHRAWAPLATLATAAVAAAALLMVAQGPQGEVDSATPGADSRGEILVALALGDAANDAAASDALPDDLATLEEALGL